MPSGQRCPCRAGDRPSPSSGVTSTWRYRKLRKFYLDGHPQCERSECPYPATEADHIKPVHQYPDLALDPENLMALCRDHHQAKTNADRRRTRKPRDDGDDEFTVAMPPR
ncbi:HNH endonuclease signature motif containing protein [Mycolicibacterium hippocampi]